MFFAKDSLAATYCVRSGASGNGSGSDWTNAYTALPATPQRGSTYYVAGGNYSGATFSTPVSGTSLITIKGATVADHGTNTGWSDSYSVETAQATWTSSLLFTSSYWVFDGSIGSMTKTATAYGFSFGTTLDEAIWLGTSGTVQNNGPAITNLSFSHIYAKATSADVEKEFIQGNYAGGAHSNITLSHSFIDGWQGAVMTRGQSGTAYDSWTFDHDIFLNGYSSPAHHGEWINPNERPMTNLVVRYCWFEGYSGDGGMTGTIVANNNDNTNAKIYGNVFYNLLVGNGIISGTSQGNLNNAVIYNNSFVSMNSASGVPIGGPGSGNVAYNNLFYNTRAEMNATSDYNVFFSATNVSPETHGQTGSVNPFVSSIDFHLKAATQSGITLASPYNMDGDGKIRGADGTWDRGAYEYGGTPPPTDTIPPAAPTGVTIR